MGTLFSTKHEGYSNIRIPTSKQVLIFVLLIWGTTGCDRFVDVDMPTSQLPATAVYQDEATAQAAMIAIYADIRDSGILTGRAAGLSNQMGNYTDELDFYGDASLSTQQFYNNSIIPSNSSISDWWRDSYHQIYMTNAVIEGVKASPVLKQTVKDQLLGEALFIRALVHFYLVNLFGDIPYVTTTDYEQNSKVSRLESPEVYTRIEDDLLQAVNLFPEDYQAISRARPNKAATQALLSRVYLYAGAWPEAADMASAVLNRTSVYTLEINLDDVFLKDSPSTIWQLMSETEGQNTMEGETFILISAPPSQRALSNHLIDTFEPGDLRKEHWVGTVTDGDNTWYYPYKYKQRSRTTTSLEYSVIFRLAEQYLIRAEARAQQGDIIGARDDLNKIRSRAGLNETTALTQQELLETIGQERQAEFFTEHGHRFFDLKRTGQLQGILSSTKPGWDNFENLLPLPESEILINPNLLPQNPGYQ